MKDVDYKTTIDKGLMKAPWGYYVSIRETIILPSGEPLLDFDKLPITEEYLKMEFSPENELFFSLREGTVENIAILSDQDNF